MGCGVISTLEASEDTASRNL
ncbi:hypothetical protein Bhyg_09514 [Pseudolycoriella hygida]|uniref:Uncharacterized protein n=1 Tax=Pseudolycoriella hygida TaxID=35572 RepID=A0A9Q0S5V0_9DIPT|nr:hypothetical protein Bhyg_09514 [Pseudolycoriella hygida]